MEGDIATVEAELIRDSALEVAGLLTKTVGGRSIRPPQPEGVPEPRADDPEGWEESQGPTSGRITSITTKATAPFAR